MKRLLSFLGTLLVAGCELLVAGCGLLVAGCGLSDKPIGPVQVGGGIAQNGDTLVILSQGWERGGIGDPDIYTKSSVLRFHADGSSQRADSGTPVLASDCSERPPQLPSCTAAKMATSGSETSWTYALLDGSRIVISVPSAGKGTIARIAPDNSTRWMRGDVSRPHSAIWGASLLIANANATALESLLIDTGETTWSYIAPDAL